MSKEPIIKTDRLILRPLTLGDAEACYSWNSDERVTKYMSYSTYTNISQTFICRYPEMVKGSLNAGLLPIWWYIEAI